MKNCNCKETQTTTLCKPDPCNFVYKMPVDECTNQVVYYITLASAVLMECSEGAKTVEQELNEIKNKLIELDYINNDDAWQNLINKLKLHLTDLDPELTNLIKSLIALHLDGIDYDALAELFEDKFDEWKRHLDDLLGNINNIEFDQTPTQGSNNAVTSNGIYEALGNLTDNVRMQYEELLSRNTDNEIVFPMGALVKSMYLYTQEEYNNELFDFLNGLIYTKYEIGYIFGITKESVYELPNVKDRVLMKQLSNYSYDSDYNSSGFKSLEGESINLIFNEFEYRSLSSEDKENATEISEGGRTKYSLSITLTDDILHKFHDIVKSNESMFLTPDRSRIDFVPIGNSYDSEQRLGTPIRLSETVLKKLSNGSFTDNIVELRNNSVYYDSAHKCFFVYIKLLSDERIIPISNSIIVNENSKFDDLLILHTIFGLQLTLNCTNIKDDGSKTKTLIPLTYFTGALIQGSVLTDYSKETTLNPVVYTASFSKDDESGNTVYTLNLMELFGQRCTPTGEGQLRCITKVSNSGNDEP